MNKKEVSEIKKNFASESGYFVLNKILTAFVDAEKNLLCHNIMNGFSVPDDEMSVYDETFKKVLSTSVGKKFIEYAFNKEAYEDDGAQNILYKFLRSGMGDAESETFLNHIIQYIEYTGPFTIMTAYCTYTPRKKNKNDEFDDSGDEVYNYLLTAICPADTGADGFVFNRDNNELEKRLNIELIVDKAPTDGFLFPAFSDRSSDINHVMYYNKSPKDPNISIIDEVLGCSFRMSSDMEKASFQTILSNAIGDDLDYTIINTVNEQIKELIAENRDSTDNITLEAKDLENIFTVIGIPTERVNMVKPVYEKVCGDCILTASNVIDYKNIVEMPGIKVDIKATSADKVRTSVIDGRRCLLIDIDDPTIEINGMSVSL